KIRYVTRDIRGDSTVASGALMMPEGTGCDSLSMISYAHGTVLEKEDVPSRYNQEAIIATLMASTGRIVVAPDYLGLGDNPGLHPYLHGESEATATIDLIRATSEFLNTSSSVTRFNGHLLI